MRITQDKGKPIGFWSVGAAGLMLNSLLYASTPL
ncbi:Uncharacterised protein [Legionella birminghamensis]|uniref:Uncharacterized protein n=1 Tax=Legionella birminghamensis TaxID=28083 RepID=A0A378I7Y1_9GAMM|nr:Uncharacterised protein [Legionella birminghamensis]